MLVARQKDGNVVVVGRVVFGGHGAVVDGEGVVGDGWEAAVAGDVDGEV